MTQETPDAVVAKAIVEEFKSKSILSISEDRWKAFCENIETGALSEQDWRLIAEKSLVKPKEDSHAKEN